MRVHSIISKYLIILDGHKTHLTFEILTNAIENRMDMVTLPSHTSHEL